MSKYLIRCTGEGDRWTFKSEEELCELLSLTGKCLGHTKKPPCAKKINQKHFKSNKTALLKAGFPCEMAESCLRRLAVHCVCSIQVHDILVDNGGNRETQHSYLYTKWHRLLWTEYLKANNAYDGHQHQNIPPLHLPSRWEEVLSSSLGTTMPELLPEETVTALPIHPPKRAQTFSFTKSRIFTLWKQALPSNSSSKPDRPGIGTHDASAHATTLPSRGLNDTQIEKSHGDLRNGKSSLSWCEAGLGQEDADKDVIPSMPPILPVTTPSKTDGRALREALIEGYAKNDFEQTPLSVASSSASMVFTPTKQHPTGTPISDFGSSHNGDDHLRLGVSNMGSPLERGQSRKQGERSDGRPSNRRATTMPHGSPVGRTSSGVSSVQSARERPRMMRMGDDTRFDIKIPNQPDHVIPMPSAPGEITLFLCPGEDAKEKFPFLDELELETGTKFTPEPCPKRYNMDQSDTNVEKTHASNRSPFDHISKDDKEALNQLLCKLEKPIYEDKMRAGGYVYGFTRLGAEDFIKIGSSIDVFHRFQDFYNQCGYKPKPIFSASMPCAARVMESLIHLYLHSFQRRDTRCTSLKGKCKREHTEWFEVPTRVALEAVAKWQKFSIGIPFSDGGRLKRPWQNEVTRAQRRFHQSNGNSKYQRPESWVQTMMGVLKKGVREEEHEVLSEIKLAIRLKNEDGMGTLELIDQGDTVDRILTSADVSFDGTVPVATISA